jgi:hypothetical protein
MSKYESELRRRLDSGADIEETARWYADCMIAGKVRNEDLTEFEMKFWKQYLLGYLRWMRNQSRH